VGAAARSIKRKDVSYMTIVFSGDRRSKTISIGYFLRKLFGKKHIEISLWDGYKSRVYVKK
jgi:hypothetical protein